MKTIYPLLLLGMSLVQIEAFCQKNENYVKGEVIVHFREGVLDHALLPATASQPARLNTKDVIKNEGVSGELEKLGVTGMRKLIRRSSPLIKTSVSRTGEEITIPHFYNIMYAYVPESYDIKIVCEALNKLVKH